MPVFRERQGSLGLLCFLGLFFLLGTGCHSASVSEQAEEVVKIGEEQLKDIDFVLSNAGRVKVSLQAPCLYRYRLVKNSDKGYTQIDENTPLISEFNCGLHMYFLDTSGQIDNTVVAAYGRYEGGENDVLLRQNVRIGNKKGDSLFTEELYYDDSSKRFFTDSPVLIKGKDHTIRGVGFESLNDMSHYTIYKVTHSELHNLNID